MSTGLVICSACNHELHQDGNKSVMNGWQHCDLKTPMCVGAGAIYPDSLNQIKGKWCGRDDDSGKFSESPIDMDKLRNHNPFAGYTNDLFKK